MVKHGHPLTCWGVFCSYLCYHLEFFKTFYTGDKSYQYLQDATLFLGGLSLHLNHLIAECMSAHYWQFGTLPIGIFCQIWSQDSLRHLLWHLTVTFEICQLLVTPGPFEYFGQNWVSSENQSFLDEGAMGLRCDLGVLGSQITRLYDGTILGGGVTHLRGSRGPSKKWNWKIAFFGTFATA